MNTPRENIGTALRNARRRTGMSLQQLASKMGKDPSAGARQISRWENGADHGAMKVEDLIELAEAASTNAAAILTAAGYGTAGSDVESALRSDPQLSPEDIDEMECLLARKRHHAQQRIEKQPRNTTPPAKQPAVAFTQTPRAAGRPCARDPPSDAAHRRRARGSRHRQQRRRRS